MTVVTHLTAITRREALAAFGLTVATALVPDATIANAQLGSRVLGAGDPRRLGKMPSLADYGPLGSGDDSAVFAAAIADATTNNTRDLWIPPGTYVVSSTVVIDADDLRLIGHGATISSALARNKPLIKVGGDNVSVTGLRTLLTAATTKAHHFSVNGRNCHVDHCQMDYAHDQNTPAFYVRGADGFQLTNSSKRGSNAFIGFLEASDVLIASNRIYGVRGGDDAFAIKAINQASENIRIIGNYIFRHSAIVSFGSQIGMAAADDPSHSRGVRKVLIQGNIAEQCGRIAFIKPGALRYDYRDGVVEDVVFNENTLSDPSGFKFEAGFDIRAGHRAIVRNIRGDGNRIYARAEGDSSTGHKVGALLIQHSGGGPHGTIENIDIGITYADPHDGAAYGAAGTLGYPVESIVRIDPRNLRLGTINLRIEGNGCSSSGVLVGPGADKKIRIEKLKLTNYNATNNKFQGGVRTASAILVKSSDVLLRGKGRPKIADPGGLFIDAPA